MSKEEDRKSTDDTMRMLLSDPSVMDMLPDGADIEDYIPSSYEEEK
jgi:hypothetical protein